MKDDYIKKGIEELLRLLYDIRDNLDEMDITEYSQLMRIDIDIDEALSFEGMLMSIAYPKSEGDGKE